MHFRVHFIRYIPLGFLLVTSGIFIIQPSQYDSIRTNFLAFPLEQYPLALLCNFLHPHLMLMILLYFSNPRIAFILEPRTDDLHSYSVHFKPFRTFLLFSFLIYATACVNKASHILHFPYQSSNSHQGDTFNLFASPFYLLRFLATSLPAVFIHLPASQKMCY